ncbi:MAG: amidohydrolase family protein, partial [Clostridiales bacterium]|nr:amidohydrolase family protein [Clostridiales bacterium]
MNIYHGTIISCDSQNGIYQYLVEENGLISYVGDQLPLKYKDEKITELGKQVLIPSFADTHLHFASMALFHGGVNVMKVASNVELKEKLVEFLPKTKAKVVIAFGASPHSVAERTLLSREDLDSVSDKRPIMVVKYDGHACIVNTPLLSLLPESIKSIRGYNPQTGEMNQEAFFATTDYVTSTVSVPELIKSMQKAIDYMAGKGIGLIHTVSGVGFPKDLDVDMERYVGRGVQGGFQMRLFFQTMDTDKVLKRKLPRIGGCFATALDGCFGSMDAALQTPYEGTDQCGVLYYSLEEVTQFCKKANRLGLQIELHAIGDAAFTQATKAIKAALDDYPRTDHRHGIIHACLPTKEGLEICREYRIQIPLQTSFIEWPQEPDWYLKSILGEREAQLNPLRSFLDHNILISAGSDSPCTDPDPMFWIHSACNHPIKEQALTITEALRMATYQGYWTSFDEKERGSLETGKIADMVILEDNPYKVSIDKLKDIS